MTTLRKQKGKLANRCLQGEEKLKGVISRLAALQMYVMELEEKDEMPYGTAKALHKEINEIKQQAR